MYDTLPTRQYIRIRKGIIRGNRNNKTISELYERINKGFIPSFPPFCDPKAQLGMFSINTASPSLMLKSTNRFLIDS